MRELFAFDDLAQLFAIYVFADNASINIFVLVKGDDIFYSDVTYGDVVCTQHHCIAITPKITIKLPSLVI